MTANIEDSEIHKYVSGKWKKLPTDGEITKIKRENDIGNLQTKTLPELEDLLLRQEKILKNRKFISNLHDKGKKLKTRSDEIRTALEALKSRESLSIEVKSDQKVKDVQALEWPDGKPGKVEIALISESHDVDSIDDGSDTEDLNPLKLMANHSRDVPADASSRLVENCDPIAAIKEELDKLNIKDSKVPSTVVEHSGINKSCLSHDYNDYEEKLEKSIRKIEEVSQMKRKPFKPFQTLRNTALPCQIKEHNSPLWMESAATGPLKQLTMKPAQTISLDDSIKLLNENKNLEKEKEYWKTIEGLSKTSKDFTIGLPDGPQMNYRDTNTTVHLLDENFDSEDEEFQY